MLKYIGYRYINPRNDIRMIQIYCFFFSEETYLEKNEFEIIYYTYVNDDDDDRSDVA